MNAQLVVLLTGSMVMASATMAGASARPPAAPLATVDLALSDGAPAGTAAIEQDGKGLKLIVAAKGLPAGVHGIHLHAVGQCDGPAFITAGAHLNPHGRQHGFDNPAGSHLGDLPNLTAAADGNAGFTTPLHGSREELLQALFDADGTALVVHATADDNRTDPSGNSGGRIACGVLKRAS